MAATARLRRPVAAATAGDGGCGTAAAGGNGGCGVRWRLQRPVTALGSAGCGDAEARVSGSGKKNQALITMLEEKNSCRIG
jgi:hypothetical protein